MLRLPSPRLRCSALDALWELSSEETSLSVMTHERPDHVVQRTRHDSVVCQGCIPRAGALSLGRLPNSTFMRWLILPTLFSVALFGCGRSSSPSVRSAVPLPSLSVADIPAPTQAIVTVEPGGNLRAIGAAAYGHERFSGFVAALNGIRNPERVAAGAVLKTPSIAMAFKDAGADAAFQPALYALAKACTDYHTIEPSYLAARRASGVSSGKFAIDAALSAKLAGYADLIDAGVSSLASTRAPHSVPQMAIGQFRQAAGHIRELAAGEIDGYGYDYDLVGQRLGLGFTNALIWTQQHHRE